MNGVNETPRGDDGVLRNTEPVKIEVPEPIGQESPVEIPITDQVSDQVAQEDNAEAGLPPVVADVSSDYPIPQNYTGPYEDLLEVDTEIDSVKGVEALDSESAPAPTSTASGEAPASENGRASPPAKGDAYYLPVPSEEKETYRLSIQHQMWLLSFNQNLFLSPIESPKEVLDVGTGTGIWAYDFAKKFPESNVLGIDLSEVKTPGKPSNCTFQVADAEEPWAFSKKFDLIHGRALTSCFDDPVSVFRSANAALKPGGWLEVQDMVVPMRSADDTFPGTAIDKYSQHFVNASTLRGRPVARVENYDDMFRTAGFIDVVKYRFAWPMNPWPRGAVNKRIGKIYEEDMKDGMHGFAKALLSRVYSMSEEEIKAVVDPAREDVGNTNIHAFMPIVVVMGRKPHDDEIQPEEAQAEKGTDDPVVIPVVEGSEEEKIAEFAPEAKPETALVDETQEVKEVEVEAIPEEIKESQADIPEPEVIPSEISPETFENDTKDLGEVVAKATPVDEQEEAKGVSGDISKDPAGVPQVEDVEIMSDQTQGSLQVALDVAPREELSFDANKIEEKVQEKAEETTAEESVAGKDTAAEDISASAIQEEADIGYDKTESAKFPESAQETSTSQEPSEDKALPVVADVEPEMTIDAEEKIDTATRSNIPDTTEAVAETTAIQQDSNDTAETEAPYSGEPATFEAEKPEEKQDNYTEITTQDTPDIISENVYESMPIESSNTDTKADLEVDADEQVVAPTEDAEVQGQEAPETSAEAATEIPIAESSEETTVTGQEEPKITEPEDESQATPAAEFTEAAEKETENPDIQLQDVLKVAADVIPGIPTSLTDEISKIRPESQTVEEADVKEPAKEDVAGSEVQIKDVPAVAELSSVLPTLLKSQEATTTTTIPEHTEKPTENPDIKTDIGSAIIKELATRLLPSNASNDTEAQKTDETEPSQHEETESSKQ